MKAYGVPRFIELESPDVATIKEFAIKEFAIKGCRVKNRKATRRYFKKAERLRADRETRRESDGNGGE